MKMTFGRCFAIVFCFLMMGLGGCQTYSSNGPGRLLTVATYNVDNFFGTVDPIRQRGDKPKSEEDVKAVSDMIHMVGADVLVLQEVQAGAVLPEFERTRLSDMDYKVATFDPNADSRGLTVAVLSRFPVIKTVCHKEVPLDPSLSGADAAKESNHFARDLFRVDVQVRSGVVLTVYALHLKSTSDFKDDPKSAKWRMREAVAAARIIRNEVQTEHLKHVVVAGDFNAGPDSEVVKTIENAMSPPLVDALDYRVGVNMIVSKEESRKMERDTFVYKDVKATVDTVLLSTAPSGGGQGSVIDTVPRGGSSHYPVSVRIGL